MHMHHLNLLAVLVAAISTMLVGFLWYSPFLFAKPWMREMGYDPNDKASADKMRKSAGPAYTGSFIASALSSNIFFIRPGSSSRVSTSKMPLSKNVATTNKVEAPRF